MIHGHDIVIHVDEHPDLPLVKGVTLDGRKLYVPVGLTVEVGPDGSGALIARIPVFARSVRTEQVDVGGEDAGRAIGILPGDVEDSEHQARLRRAQGKLTAWQDAGDEVTSIIRGPVVVDTAAEVAEEMGRDLGWTP